MGHHPGFMFAKLTNRGISHSETNHHQTSSFQHNGVSKFDFLSEIDALTSDSFLEFHSFISAVVDGLWITLVAFKRVGA